ncbi:MAG: chemotaxis protein CheX [Proteobacteria bacterium]|nr:chemotaxis protein CheX [Pseudomonadota bacterium]MBU1638921.1 chemotaxis protein CheX [Pseudomonadota bacterium]
MINEELQEVLSELINIAFGSATATIADLFDNFATLHIPDISFIALADLDQFILKDFNYQEIYTSTQQFKGRFQGEIVFAMDKDSAQNMQRIIFAEDDPELDGLQNVDELKQSILEIANILGSSCIGKLAELLSTNVTFAPPSIEFSQNLIKDSDNMAYNHVIVISTVLDFKDMEFLGKLFIMFTDEMFAWLEAALEEYMDNL